MFLCFWQIIVRISGVLWNEVVYGEIFHHPVSQEVWDQTVIPLRKEIFYPLIVYHHYQIPKLCLSTALTRAAGWWWWLFSSTISVLMVMVMLVQSPMGACIILCSLWNILYPVTLLSSALPLWRYLPAIHHSFYELSHIIQVHILVLLHDLIPNVHASQALDQAVIYLLICIRDLDSWITSTSWCSPNYSGQQPLTS